jgi:excisionase family DNA binding protein
MLPGKGKSTKTIGKGHADKRTRAFGKGPCMPVIRRYAAPSISPDPCADKSPFMSVEEVADYLKESKRTVRELVKRKVFKLALNSTGKEKPWRLLRSQVEQHARDQVRKAAA